MEEASREMTLEECIRKIPPDHGAMKEFMKMRDAIADAKAIFEKFSETRLKTISLDWLENYGKLSKDN